MARGVLTDRVENALERGLSPEAELWEYPGSLPREAAASEAGLGLLPALCERRLQGLHEGADLWLSARALLSLGTWTSMLYCGPGHSGWHLFPHLGGAQVWACGCGGQAAQGDLSVPGLCWLLCGLVSGPGTMSAHGERFHFWCHCWFVAFFQVGGD